MYYSLIKWLDNQKASANFIYTMALIVTASFVFCDLTFEVIKLISGFLPHEDHTHANIGANEHDTYKLYGLVSKSL